MNVKIKPWLEKAALPALSLMIALLTTAQLTLAGGGIVGKVKYAGSPPKPHLLKVDRDTQVCGAQPVYSEDLLVSQSSGLANVVVYLPDYQGADLFEPNGDFAEMDQAGCVFVPHVVMVSAGAKMFMLNSDGILHNVHTHSKSNPPKNIAQPKFLKRLPLTFGTPEFIKVACDAHSWMTGWIVVAAHKFYALTDSEGNFALHDVPAGTYEMAFWHESLGTRKASVTVEEGKESTVSVEFPAK